MTQRRFTDKPILDPESVMALPEDHAAMAEDRTMFPNTVVTVTEDQPARLLVSGEHNRKLGKTVAKGTFKGYGLYSLSLEERATCPKDCEVRDVCYGNGMQLARRHRIGDPDVFFDRMGFEILSLLDKEQGLLIRLHVLGDFPSVEYVQFWEEVLEENPKVAVFGYTHRASTNWGGDEIGDAIEAVKTKHPERFRIRWSSPTSRPDGAVVISHVPPTPRIGAGIICPAQTDATACCASCGLCWDGHAKDDCIVFIKHGRSIDQNDLADLNEPTPLPPPRKDKPAPREKPEPEPIATTRADTSMRTVKAIHIPKKFKFTKVHPEPPEIRRVRPEDLTIEPAYQRDLSKRGMAFIKKISLTFSWEKYKLPVVSERDGKMTVIDGQHTAFAAATHPDIVFINVQVIQADDIKKRAESFVSHNKDRLGMTHAQVFYAECTAGVKASQEILKCVVAAGATIPRNAVPKTKDRTGQVTAIRELRMCYGRHGVVTTTRVLRICVNAKLDPISETVLRAVRMLLTEPIFAKVGNLSDSALSGAIAEIPDLDATARAHAIEIDQSRFRAAAVLISKRFLRMDAAE